MIRVFTFFQSSFKILEFFNESKVNLRFSVITMSLISIAPKTDSFCVNNIIKNCNQNSK